MRYVFIVNPVAGKGNRQQELMASIREYFCKNGGEYDILLTECPGDAKNKAHAEAQRGDPVRIFACGGEGTGLEVINGIKDFDNASFGIVPCGSANDFIKYYGDREAFLDIDGQVNGDCVRVDLIRAGDTYCINGCSVGMDAMVARDMSLFKMLPFVNGVMAYKLSVLRNFLRRLGVNIEISIDGGSFEKHSCLFAVAANAPYYGGGYMGAPDAVPDDNMLDFTLVNKISKLKVPSFLSSYKTGAHKQLDYCRLERCRSVEFRSDRPLPVNLDGEIVMSSGMSFELCDNALNLVLPKAIIEKMLIKV